MIKKSLIMTSLLLLATNTMAGDYISVGFDKGTDKLKNGSSDYTYKSTSIFFERIEKDYLFNIGYAKGEGDSSKVIYSDDLNNEYNYDYSGSVIGVDFAYKLIKKDKIFFAPYLSYSSSSSDYYKTRHSDGAKFIGTETSDTNLEAGFLIGYDYNIDSYTYISYSLDNDLLESEDKDYNELILGITHKIGDKIIIDFSYFKNMSNYGLVTGSSGISLGMGYKF